MKEEELKKNFTRRYRIAIAIIAFFSTLSFGLLFTMLSCSDSTAYIMNVSGKQRLLVARITALSQDYYLQRTQNSLIAKSPELIELSLQSLINEMYLAHHALSSGTIKPFLHATSSKAITERYVGENGLNHHMVTFFSLTKTLLMPSLPADEMKHTLNQLKEHSTVLLPILEEMVKLYQEDGEAKLTLIKKAALLLWVLTLLTLLLEIFFIFNPIARTLKLFFQQTLSQQRELEQQIKIRTLSLEEANEKLNHLASHDPLTGLKNRLHMESTLEKLMLHYQINTLPYAVAMFDIDWFKKINDEFGHDTGDFVLKELAKIFTLATRPQDSIYRSGGEEFVIIFNQMKSEDAINRCELLRLRVEQHLFVYKNLEFSITISGGIFHPEKQTAQSLSDVLKHADNALYAAKSKGRNKIVMSK